MPTTTKKRADRRAVLTDALVAALAGRPGLDKHQLRTHLEAGGIAAESGEINSVLYRRDDLFRADGPPPPRWYLAEEVRRGLHVGALDRHGELSTAITPIPVAPRDALAQLEPVPTYRPAPFQMRPALLADKAPPRSWGEFSSRACATIEDPLVDRLVISCGSPDLRIAVERVILGFPWFVAWCAVADDGLASILLRRRWHVWEPPNAPDWDRPGLIVHSAISPAAVTWRSERPLGAVRATLGLFYDGLRVRSLAELLIEVVRAEGVEASRRRTEAEKKEDYKKQFVSRGFKGFVNPVRGRCSCCGLPLRDPVSLRRGIGPDCWDNFYREFPDYVHGMRRADVRAQLWLGAVEAETFRRRVAEALEVAREPGSARS